MKVIRHRVMSFGMGEPCPEFSQSEYAVQWSADTGIQCPRTLKDLESLDSCLAIVSIKRAGDNRDPMTPLTLSELDSIRRVIVADMSERHILGLLELVIGDGLDHFIEERCIPVEQLLQIVRFSQLQDGIDRHSRNEIDELQAAAWLSIAKAAGVAPLIRCGVLGPTSHHQLVRHLARQVADEIWAIVDDSPMTIDGLHESLGELGTLALLSEIRDKCGPSCFADWSRWLGIERAELLNSGNEVSFSVLSALNGTEKRTEDQTIVCQKTDDDEENLNNQKKPWNSKAADLCQLWFKKMRKTRKKIPRSVFLREFLAEHGDRLKWKRIKVSTEVRRLQDNKDRWEPEYQALIQELELDGKNGR